MCPPPPALCACLTWLARMSSRELSQQLVGVCTFTHHASPKHYRRHTNLIYYLFYIVVLNIIVLRIVLFCSLIGVPKSKGRYLTSTHS